MTKIIKHIIINFILLLFIIINLSYVISLGPSGANSVFPISNQTAPNDPPQSVSAVAGNVSEINIVGFSTTQTWQGYFGNVTGTVELTDINNNTFYNWSTLSPRGEVYASNSSSVIWTNIQCFNFSANGTFCSEDSVNAGGTSKCGMNLTQLESYYNINESDVDGVNETFTRNDHSEFYTNNLHFSAGECKNTKLYDGSGIGVFDEVLLFSPESKSLVFTSILKDNTIGFDGNSHHFEMLVLEDGHYTDTSVTTYYFYVELQ